MPARVVSGVDEGDGYAWAGAGEGVVPRRHNAGVLIAAAPLFPGSLSPRAPGAGGVRSCPLTDTGQPAGPVVTHSDLATLVRASPDQVRWVWPATAECYPALLRAGVRVARCHDAELTEALLLGYEGRWGQPRGLVAAHARLTGAAVPADPPPRPTTPPGEGQAVLFDTAPPVVAPTGFDPLGALVAVYGHQCARITAAGGHGSGPGGTPRPGPTPEPGAAAGRLRLLAAAESAGALAAAEMSWEGLPWRADVHDAVLRELLGDPSPVGGLPRRLAELAAEIATALDVRRLHPESPAEVLRAFARQGVTLPSTRAWVLRAVDHPAVRPLLEFKELYRIFVAHGWSWCAQWVTGGRFRPEYVPGGVVSGRWATRGGGALQIPRAVRRAVVADPGWTFVVADAGQLEPRILAACSGDPGMMRAAGTGDMYATLAADAFGGDRAVAKVALLGAMYGQTGGQAAPALAALRHSYPAALAYVERAARTGEAGGLVRSWLGRTCPPPSATWHGMGGRGTDGPETGEEIEIPDASWDSSAGAGAGGAGTGDRSRGWRASPSAARARGRFTRNFVIQATAAEWALALLAAARTALRGGPAALVFFQHDEVVVHTPVGQAPAVVDALRSAGAAATRLLFGDTPVRFPLGICAVECYADAK